MRNFKWAGNRRRSVSLTLYRPQSHGTSCTSCRTELAHDDIRPEMIDVLRNCLGEGTDEQFIPCLWRQRNVLAVPLPGPFAGLPLESCAREERLACLVQGDENLVRIIERGCALSPWWASMST